MTSSDRWIFSTHTDGDDPTSISDLHWFVNKQDFDVEKAKGKFDINMGRVLIRSIEIFQIGRSYNSCNFQIPILEIDGQEISQSSTITRYVAKKYGFAGSNDVEEGDESRCR